MNKKKYAAVLILLMFMLPSFVCAQEKTEKQTNQKNVKDLTNEEIQSCVMNKWNWCPAELKPQADSFFGKEKIQWSLGISATPFKGTGKSDFFGEHENSVNTYLIGPTLGRRTQFAEKHAWGWEFSYLFGQDTFGYVFNFGYIYLYKESSEMTYSIIPKIGYAVASFKLGDFEIVTGEKINVSANASGILMSVNGEIKKQLTHDIQAFAQAGLQTSSLSTSVVGIASSSGESAMSGIIVAGGMLFKF